MVVIRRKGKYGEATRRANRERNMLREANKALRKLNRLLKRSRDGKPGGIMHASYRHELLYTHINILNQQAKFPSKS